MIFFLNGLSYSTILVLLFYKICLFIGPGISINSYTFFLLRKCLLFNSKLVMRDPALISITTALLNVTI